MNRFRSIRAKFLVGFFLIFSISFLMLNQTMTRLIQTSNERIITDDLIGVKNNGNSYVRQAYMINHYASDQLYFGEIAREMAGDLERATSSQVGAYTTGGELLYATDPAALERGTGEDLSQAMRGATAYTITYAHGTASVTYAYPVVVDGVKVGILRYAKEFDLLYAQSSRILNAIFYSALAIFAVAFLFSYLLSRHISIPLGRLAGASAEVTKGNLDVRLSMRRKDEIGRLSGNFNEMIGQIRRQIDRIASDRDRLERMNVERKQFYDNVTHELKTPLTSILGYAEIIREKGEKDPAFFRKGMTHIVEESQRLHQMVVALLEESKGTGSESQPERIDAGRLLKDVSDAMAFKALRYNTAIRCETQIGLYVRAQPNRLRQLFINLLDNAIKYGDANTEIRLSAETDKETVRVTIVNEGDEIPPERLAGLREPLHTQADRPARERGSVGLGLPIAREIAESLGGRIDIRSERRLTRVCVELPIPREERLPHGEST
ncbi:cell wall metabolism sensor histidine kinase WalK [Cohnella sp. REN36]|uniref:sensor histidine kinase n=1 Tax=Cohnella sp. REN36 TaxID=2887347 RepID=UPI001D13E7D4|nr:HAMP domain-containing sensor histidine kinase [Cohnella sp. REN36]MCC3371511.1 HAMP domain-containing histidine kinase [Cohnella sp. REN36]